MTSFKKDLILPIEKTAFTLMISAICIGGSAWIMDKFNENATKPNLMSQKTPTVNNSMTNDIRVCPIQNMTCEPKK